MCNSFDAPTEAVDVEKKELKRATNRRSAQLSRKRKKHFVEELIKEQTDDLRRKEQILCSVPDLIVTFDSTGRLGFVSHSVSNFLDFKHLELEGTSFWNRLCDESVRLMKAAFMDALANRTPDMETAPLGDGLWELRLKDKDATMIQAAFRSFSCSVFFLDSLTYILEIQSQVRRSIAIEKRKAMREEILFREKIRSATMIQTAFRSFCCSVFFLDSLTYILEIQSQVRRSIAIEKMKAMREEILFREKIRSATVIQLNEKCCEKQTLRSGRNNKESPTTVRRPSITRGDI